VASWFRQWQRWRADTYNLKVEKGLSPVRRSAAPDYELHLSTALGKGKQFVNQGQICEELVGGWQFAGVLTLPGGTPLM